MTAAMMTVVAIWDAVEDIAHRDTIHDQTKAVDYISQKERQDQHTTNSQPDQFEHANVPGVCSFHDLSEI